MNKRMHIDTTAPDWDFDDVKCPHCKHEWSASYEIGSRVVECPECWEKVPLVNASKKAGQSHAHSFLEANANTFIGFGLSIMCWMYLVPVIWPDMAPHTQFDKAIGITLLFTALSIGRNYVVRRVFNHLHFGRKK